MATADRRRSKRHADDDEDLLPGEKPRRGHAFRNGSLAMLAILLLALFFAPTIIARTSLRNSLLASALELDGSITLGRMSLGWFSSIVVDDVELRDGEDRLLATIGQIRTAKSLLGLITGAGDVGRVSVDRPVLHIVCDEEVTNLEQALGNLIDREERAKVAIALKISDGSVEIEDVPTARSFKVEKLAVECAVAESEQPLVLAASGELTNGSETGQFKLNLETKRSDDGKNPLASGKIVCDSSGLPLELTDPLLRRVVEGARLEGRLSTRLNGAWGNLAEQGEASIQGETLVTNLAFAADAIGHDQVRLDRIEVPCHIVQQGETLDVEELAVRCELGNVSLKGTAKMADFSAEDKVAELLKENYQVNGELDLVAIARVLPETLRIREGTEITSGKIQLAITGGHEDGQSVWSGQIDASHLGANADGKALVWENPLAIDFAARDSAAGLVLDRAECTSSFLHATAAGSLNDMSATANFDLARLVDELKQFADLSQLALQGTGEAQLKLKRSDGDQFTASGRFEARDFQFVPVSGGQPWREEKLVATLELGGNFEGESLNRIERGMATVDIGPERCSAQLVEPVEEPLSSVWPIACTWQGDLAPWATRLDACLGITDWDVRGTGSLDARLNVSKQSIALEQAQLDFAQLQMTGHGWFVSEPTMTMTCQGNWDRQAQRGTITAARLTSGTTAAVVSNASLQRGDSGAWNLDGGTAQFGADLATLYRWRHDPRAPAAWRVSGRLAVQAKLRHDAENTSARLDGVIDQLMVVDLQQPGTGTSSGSWQEPRITLAALANYRTKSQELKIEQAQLAAAAILADAKGVVPLSEEGGPIDVAGTLTYDWQQLGAIWRPLLGDGGTIVGRQSRPFALAGKLSGSPLSADSWNSVTGEAAIGWSGMNVHGFVVGPGDVGGTLADGQVQVKPMDVAVSEGRFTFAPVIRITPAPAEIYIPRGPVLTNIHLSPEMCKRGIKFIAPIVAETTVAEGQFSVSMDGGRVPLRDPKGGDVAGHMAIRAQVNPGPVAQEFMVVVNELLSVIEQGNFKPLNDQTGALLSVDTSDIEFRMVQRRMYHKNLKFVIGTLPITTYGSVGLDDESLAMVAEIPVQANILGQDVALGSLEGQTIQVPIGGTLSKPQLDRSALRQITASILQSLTRGVLQNGLGKQLERLFPLRQQPVPAP